MDDSSPTRSLRMLHLTAWIAVLAMLAGLLGYLLWVAMVYLVLSPLLLLGFIVGGAIGHGYSISPAVARGQAEYLILLVLLLVLTASVTLRVVLLVRPETRLPTFGLGARGHAHAAATRRHALSAPAMARPRGGSRDHAGWRRAISAGRSSGRQVGSRPLAHGGFQSAIGSGAYDGRGGPRAERDHSTARHAWRRVRPVAAW